MRLATAHPDEQRAGSPDCAPPRVRPRIGRSILGGMAPGAESAGAVDVDPPAEGALRVVVADDDVLLRAGLASLLGAPGLRGRRPGRGRRDLLDLVRELVPDVVLVDIRMPPTQTVEGLDAAADDPRGVPDIAILVLSAHVEVEHAMTLLAGGRGIGYLLKTRVVDVDDFVDTVRRVAKGGSVVDPALVQELVSAQRRDNPLDRLSDREREVLALMAEGRSNAGIAQALWVTEGTVEKHVRSILGKLDLPESATDHRRVLAVITFLQGH